jgi:hypothetical protein
MAVPRWTLACTPGPSAARICSDDARAGCNGILGRWIAEHVAVADGLDEPNALAALAHHNRSELVDDVDRSRVARQVDVRGEVLEIAEQNSQLNGAGESVSADTLLRSKDAAGLSTSL